MYTPTLMEAAMFLRSHSISAADSCSGSDKQGIVATAAPGRSLHAQCTAAPSFTCSSTQLMLPSPLRSK
jgi:hypothetical protein